MNNDNNGKLSYCGSTTVEATVDEKLEYYVYALLDPTDNVIFYVGKGKNGRIVDHIKEAKAALKSQRKQSKKVERILKVLTDLGQIKFLILRSGLSEKNAYEVEGTMIDFLMNKDYDFSRIADLQNVQGGHHNDTNGMMTFDDMQRIVSSEPAIINDGEKILAISINSSYFPSKRDVYAAVRSCWHVDVKHAQRARYIATVFQGVIVGLYENAHWQEVMPSETPSRYEFNADQVEDQDVKDRLLYHKWMLGFGSGNPIRYNYL